MKDYYRSSASENISDDRRWAQDRNSGVGGSSRWESFWFSAQLICPTPKSKDFLVSTQISQDYQSHCVLAVFLYQDIAGEFRPS